MRWLMTLLLVFSLVACGGGDDAGGETADTDDAVTSTAVEPTATTRPSPTPTVAASPTSAGSPVAIVTRQPSGTGIQPAGTQPATDEPTPTSRPVTVVTTPRRIAQTPTPPISFDPATATPAEAESDVTVLIDETFDDPATNPFFVGETDFGSLVAVEAGAYMMAVPDGGWQYIVAESVGDLSNALILVDAGIEGEGAVGVVARSVTNADGTWNFYVCWLTSDGRAGCHVGVNDEWIALFQVEAGVVPLLEVNSLYMSAVGDEVYFDVNDVVVGTIADGASAIGQWGVYGESFAGNTAVVWFDRVTIATIDE